MFGCLGVVPTYICSVHARTVKAHALHVTDIYKYDMIFLTKRERHEGIPPLGICISPHAHVHPHIRQGGKRF